MCDIWKDNKNVKRLTPSDIEGLLSALKKFNTREVVMSGGEALLHPNFFRFCEILKTLNIKVTLLSTGLTLNQNAKQLLQWVNNIIVSLDGQEEIHDFVRNLPGAFRKIWESVRVLKSIKPEYKITGRTVIQRLNYRHWPSIIESAMKMGLDQISFLPADVSSHAFNRKVLWDSYWQNVILPARDELPELLEIIEGIIYKHSDAFRKHFIAETPEKLKNIYLYYAAFYDLNPFPFKKCNAPWVSAVIEADGNVRPCFFHEALGQIRENSLDKILNSEKGIQFRTDLDVNTDPVCRKCVCYLNLPPWQNH